MSGELLLMSAVAWCAVLPMPAIVLCAPHQVSWCLGCYSPVSWCLVFCCWCRLMSSERILMSVDMRWAAADCYGWCLVCCCFYQLMSGVLQLMLTELRCVAADVSCRLACCVLLMSAVVSVFCLCQPSPGVLLQMSAVVSVFCWCVCCRLVCCWWCQLTSVVLLACCWCLVCCC